MAMAKDKSWEIQVFNCGLYSSAFAARFGDDVIEFLASWEGVQRYINGELQTGAFPKKLPNGVWMDDKHVKVKSMGDLMHGADHRKAKSGACVDDGNSGQVYFEVAAGEPEMNLNVLIRAADGSWSTEDEAEGSNSICTKILKPGGSQRIMDWGVTDLTPEESIFTLGGKICEMCSTPHWVEYGKNISLEDHDTCQMPAEDPQFLPVRGACQRKGIDLNTAKDACAHVKDNPEFFSDCQLDFCTSGGSAAAAQDAEDELDLEQPVPKCVREGVDCDPAKVCCDAKKDNKTLNLNNVGTNNLCGDGDGKQELRYTSVLPGVDLVVKPTGNFQCKPSVTNAKNGVDGQFGVITIPAGSETEFEFTYVNTGTDSPKDIGVQPFSFLDLDEGKKGKNRESVALCGAASNAILTSNSELERIVDGDCVKVTSTTRGTGADNPVDPDNMSEIQRARTVTYTPSGSTFRATLGITGKKRGARKFMFSGGPTIACDALE